MREILAMIREYTNEDTDDVVQSWRAAADLAHSFLTKAFLEAEAENVRSVYPAYAEIWVKEVDGKVVGFIALLGSEVGAIFLDPAFHGQGIGRELMDHAVALKGAVTLDVFEKNTVGRHFYDRYGFKYVSQYVHEATQQVTLKLAYQP